MLVGCESPAPKHPGLVDPGLPRAIVGDTLNCIRLVHYVRPLYTREATKMHIQGIVEARAIVNKAGDLRNIEFLKDDPLLVQAAHTAVKKWRYTPGLLPEPFDLQYSSCQEVCTCATQLLFWFVPLS